MPRKKENSTIKTSNIINCFDDILDYIRNGGSLTQACKDNKIGKDAFYIYLRENPERQNQYTHAREGCGDFYFDEIGEIEKKLLNREIDASTARVLIDSLKWKACKLFPRAYGDMMKTQLVDGEGKGINPFDEIYKAICKDKDYVR